MENSKNETHKQLMNNPTQSTLKMRFRLPNGEEFEAEGPREFIESQRNYFLTLIGQTTKLQPQVVTPNTIPIKEHAETYLWERLLREDGELLILRRRTKLSVAETAEILVAGARVLFGKQEYSALELAKSLKASGIEGGRLDRALSSEIQSGRLIAQGSKRSRTYRLSEEGFARAFIMAEKLFQGLGGK